MDGLIPKEGMTFLTEGKFVKHLLDLYQRGIFNYKIRMKVDNAVAIIASILDNCQGVIVSAYQVRRPLCIDDLTAVYNVFYWCKWI